MEVSKKDKRYFTVTIPKIDTKTVPENAFYEIPPMPDGFYEDVLKMFRREWDAAPEFKPRRTKPMRVSVELID